MRIAVGLALLAAAVCLAAADEAEKVLPRNDATLQAILDAAKEPNRDVRARVAWVLGQLVCKDPPAALRALAADPAPEVRAAALRAMVALLDRGAGVTVSIEVPVADAGLRMAALAAARRLLFAQRDRLIEEALRAGSPAEKELAILAMELDPPDKGFPRLQAALKDADPAVRRAAATALGRTGRPEAAATVAPALDDREAPVRAAACEALGLLKSREAHAKLVLSVNDKAFIVRRKAIEALARIGDPADVGAIQARIAEDDFTIREAACVALGKVVHVSSPPLLVDRLIDEVPEVCEAAAQALARLPADMAYQAVLKYADDLKRPEARRRTWWVLGEYAHPKTADLALERLEDPDMYVRGYAMRILRKRSDERVVPRAIKVLSSPTIEKCGDIEVVEAFEAAILFQRREPIPMAMLCLQLTAAPPLEPKWLPSADMTKAAARYAGAIGHKAAAGVLRTLCDRFKTDSDFGPVVAAALEKLTGEKFALELVQGPVTGSFFIDAQPPGK